ncbi:MAG TPA: PilZ domain-containing protein [Chloroflexota bacterium]|nr:PilZ domain-containing protein [Chloroflexota bacterium]
MSSATLPSNRASSSDDSLENGLIAQPDRPTLPIRVPVVADCGGSIRLAEVIGSTGNVLLLQALDPNAVLPVLGTVVRLKVDWDRQVLNGRLAAHGVAGRFLVSIGERAIRSSRRFAVSLPGTAQSVHLYGAVEVRIADLSTGGARVEGIDLPVGSDVSLTFTPPGRTEPINVTGFVVRQIEGTEVSTLGVAFRLVQQSMDVLGRAAP